MKSLVWNPTWSAFVWQEVAGDRAAWDVERPAIGDLSVFEDLDWEEFELLTA